MSDLNVPNRTLAIMDNLPFLRSINNECIDLIAIDPPFAANETFTSRPRVPISPEELAEEVALAQAHGVPHNEGIGQTRVRDVWSWDTDVHPAWKAQIEEDYPGVFAVIQAVEGCATENEAAYICYMAVRLIECHRVLKDTGSIYVHCDSHANGYLRMLLDAIFGSGVNGGSGFQNEIVWQRFNFHADAKRFGRVTDRVLFYTKSRAYTFNRVRAPFSKQYVDSKFTHRDPDGRRFRLDNLNPPGGRGPVYEFHGVTKAWRYTEDNMRSLESEGKIYSQSNVPQLKRYLDELEGQAVHENWSNIAPLNSQARERTGYATQKPLALYERIIEASSQPGDVVLDVFAGCATTAVAAEGLGRCWIACDMAYRSWTMLKRRFYQNGYALSDMTDSTRDALGQHQTTLQEAESYTIGPNRLPARTDRDPAPFHHLQEVQAARSTQNSGWSGRIPKEDAKRLLIDRFGPVCWGCGFEPRRPNGTLDDTLLEVDHIRARRAAEGTPGDDELYNLALLHRTCNGIKRNRLTLEQLREHNALNGLLYVNSTRELVDLFEATRFAAEQIAAHVVGQR